MKQLAILLVIFPLSSHALFQRIYQGYKKSKRVKLIDYSGEISKQISLMKENQYDWNLELAASNADSDLQSIYSFQSQQTITNSKSVGLTKQTFKYGAFSLKHSQKSYDLSNWSAVSLASLEDENLFESKNEIGYSYEILNSKLKTEYSTLKKENELSIIRDQINLNKDALDFFKAYVQSKHMILLNRYYNEFKGRAWERVKLLKKRVRDGLSRSVDLSQSRLSHLDQRERIIRNKNSLNENIAILERIIGYDIEEEHYLLVDWSYKSSSVYSFILEKKKNLEFEELQKNLDLTALNLEKTANISSQSLLLNLSYAKNNVNKDHSESFRTTFGRGSNEEKVVSLSYTIPLGGIKSNALKQQLHLLNKKNELKKVEALGDVDLQISNIKNTINGLEKAILIAIKKQDISKYIVKETQKLYLRGRSTFEEVSRSEETYINSKIAYLNLLLSLELNYSNLAYMTGELFPFLERYRD